MIFGYQNRCFILVSQNASKKRFENRVAQESIFGLTLDSIGLYQKGEKDVNSIADP